MTKNIIISFLGIVLLFTGCSDKQGELVDKKTDSSSASQVVDAKESTNVLETGKPADPTNLSSSHDAKPVVRGNTAEVAYLRFTIDASWRLEQPKSAMRAAQFLLPAANSELGDGELAIFTGIFGTPEANIQRWIGQFKKLNSKPEIVKKTVGTLNVQVLDVSGILGDTMGTMVNATEDESDSRMIAMVVDGQSKGPWYFKLIGPVETLEHWKQTFDEMIDSLEPIE